MLQQACQVSHHAAAQGNDGIGAGQVVPGQKGQKLQIGICTLAGLSGGEDKAFDLKSGVCQAFLSGLAEQGIDRCFADQSYGLNFFKRLHIAAQLGQ